MKITNKTFIDFNDVLIRPRLSYVKNRDRVDLFTTFKMPHGGMFCIPIMNAGMSSIGTTYAAIALRRKGAMGVLSKNVDFAAALDYSNNWDGFISFGLEKDLSKFEKLHDSARICLDVANGYMFDFARLVSDVRTLKPNIIIMAGNVATQEGAKVLFLAGADIVKIGIGPGSVCTTRLKTGVGVPQLSAIASCAQIAKKYGGYICADGGMQCVGDVAKAFAAGADLVMSGYLFKDAKEACLSGNYYGDASLKNKDKKRYIEGKSVELDLDNQRKIDDILEEICEGLQSACSYVGASNLDEFKKNAEFIRVNRTHNEIFG